VISTGIAGLDDVLRGGLPRGKTTLVVGQPGSGKTLLGLQFLANGAHRFGEPGLHVSFEESPEALRANAASIGLPGMSEADSGIRFMDARPTLDSVANGSFDIGGLVAIIKQEIHEHGIRRIVFDGLDALFSSDGPGPVSVREFRRLTDLTEAEGATCILSQKVLRDAAGDWQARDGLEYAADAVVHLGYRLVDGLLQRYVQVIKMRGAGFAGGEHPFMIADQGIVVANAAAVTLQPVIATDRATTGIERLDEMLEGGWLRSSCTLISGLPGTAKSTIGAAFSPRGCVARNAPCWSRSTSRPSSSWPT
jgi:circadian clock protein KaiC